jgi:predicted nucleic acid-binding protein
MSADFFIDTNILVYTFDERFPAKRERAMTLVQGALKSGRGVISYQVVQEFLNVAGRKFEKPLTLHDQRRYLDTVLDPLCEVFPSIGFYHKGITISERYGYSLYDSLIIAAALQAECKTLYTEDMRAGQTIDRLTITDPF